MDKKKYVSVAGLKKGRRWTESLINKFLGEPDKLGINKYYRSGPRVRLYEIERVLLVEETPEFKADFAISQKRSLKAKEAAEKGIDTKTDKLCDLVLEHTGIYLPDYTPEELILKSCEHYNSLCWMPEHIYFKKIESGWVFRDASPQSEKPFLDRITVNYLRHTCSDYDDGLWATRGKIGKDAASSYIKNHILDVIAEKFPWLSEECESQRV